jgi:LysM repeat protein
MLSQRVLLFASLLFLAGAGCNYPSDALIPETGFTVVTNTSTIMPVAADTSTASPIVPVTPLPTTQVVETLTGKAAPLATPALTNTVAPIPSPLPAVTSAPAAVSIAGEHFVVSGESLSCIGRAYGVVPNAIADANGITLTSTLVVGQRLKIPFAQWATIPPGPVCSPQFSPPFAGQAPGSSSDSQPQEPTAAPPVTETVNLPAEPSHTATTTPTEMIFFPDTPVCTPDTGVTAVPGNC